MFAIVWMNPKHPLVIFDNPFVFDPIQISTVIGCRIVGGSNLMLNPDTFNSMSSGR